MKVTLAELLQVVGEDHVSVELVDESMRKVNRCPGGSTMVLHTDQDYGSQGMDKFGMTLWFDRRAVQHAMRLLERRHAEARTN